MKRKLILTAGSVLAIGLLGLQIAPAVAQSPYEGHRAVLGLAETLTDPASGEPGAVIWFRKDLGNKQLTHDFVYGDPRRMAFNGGYPGVTFAVDTGYPSSDVNLVDQVRDFHDSIGVWDGQTCSNLGLTENGVAAASTGAVAAFFGYGSGAWPVWYADLTQVGFVPDFVQAVLGPNVLGVTYTLFWSDGNGNLTDIDGNGKIDIAFREIYYNDAFEWSDNGNLGVPGARIFDLPTVAIHEVGHGFSQAHFGSIGVKDGFLFSKPRAVMNAIYGGLLHELQGSDVGGHCSNWAQWPIN